MSHKQISSHTHFNLMSELNDLSVVTLEFLDRPALEIRGCGRRGLLPFIRGLALGAILSLIRLGVTGGELFPGALCTSQCRYVYK